MRLWADPINIYNSPIREINDDTRRIFIKNGVRNWRRWGLQEFMKELSHERELLQRRIGEKFSIRKKGGRTGKGTGKIGNQCFRIHLML